MSGNSRYDLVGLTAFRAALASGAVLLIYNLVPLWLGVDGLVMRVPDDAFYYLVLGKNFVAKGFWTFDGTHVASGFHILYGYLIAAIYALAPAISLEQIYAATVLINTALVASAVFLLAKVNESIGLGAGNIALVLVAISSVGLRLAGFPMEACFTVFFSAVAFYLASPASDAIPGRPLLAFLTGIFGVLSRTDWGLIPLALLAGALLHMWWHAHLDRGRLSVLVLLLSGAIAGEVLVALHTYYFTGGFVQRSGSIKHHWAAVQGYTPLPGIARVVELLGPYVIPRPLMLAVLASIVGGLALRGRLTSLLDQPLALGSVLAILGFWAVYTLNGSVQYWYAANFFAATAMLASVAMASLPGRYAPIKPMLAAIFVASGAYQLARPVWTWAPAMVEAGRFLKQEPKYTPVGAWNAGIISYFAERPVTNLDGLVNDDAYPAIVGGRLASYVRERGIAYIVDFPTAFTLGAAKAGLADGQLAACKTPVRTFRDDLEFDIGALTLFEIDFTCLEK